MNFASNISLLWQSNSGIFQLNIDKIMNGPNLCINIFIKFEPVVDTTYRYV